MAQARNRNQLLNNFLVALYQTIRVEVQLNFFSFVSLASFNIGSKISII